MRPHAILTLLLLSGTSLTAQSDPVYLPLARHATTMGNASNYYPFGHHRMRYQQLHDLQDVGGANTFRYMQLRCSSQAKPGPGYGEFMLDMEMSVGETPVKWSDPSSSWAVNNPNPVLVVKRQWVYMPALIANTPTHWYITLPFAKPLAWSGRNHFCFDVRVYGNSRPTSYQLDAATGSTIRASRLWETLKPDGPTASHRALGFGLVIRLGYHPAPVPRLIPYGSGCQGSNLKTMRLDLGGLPYLNGRISLGVVDAPAQTALLLAIGNRDTRWGALPLPFDLTPVGAPGCTVLAPAILAFGAQADGRGEAVKSFNVPYDTHLKRASFYLQWYALDSPANPLGVITSRGTRAVVE